MCNESLLSGRQWVHGSHWMKPSEENIMTGLYRLAKFVSQ